MGEVMKQNARSIIENLIYSYPDLKDCRENILEAYSILKGCYDNGGKVLVCGNGGSASDSEHIVGELMKGFLQKRKIRKEDTEKIKARYPENWEYLTRNLQGTLPAMSLVSQTSLAYAFINDVAPDMVFAQQIYGYAKPEDVLIGLSTSGNSKNVVNAVKIASAFDIKTIGMTGKDGGVMKNICDVTITAPSTETYRIQEFHLPIYHALCAMLEAEYFEE